MRQAKDKLIALQPMLNALRIEQRIGFDDAMKLLGELHEAAGGTLWPGLSGNDVCAFANLVLARYGAETADVEPHELNGTNPNPPECDPRC